jgi:diadenosine tetraphosphate (Ap4A) HIT family hydrolase
MGKKKCEFCDIIRYHSSECIYIGHLAFVFWDKHPVSPGHAIVAVKGHEKNWFLLGWEIQRSMLHAVVEAKNAIIDGFKRTRWPSDWPEKLKDNAPPTGWNIGINIGESAGQTVQHAHIHVIPRYKEDVPDPTGGVRWVIPEKANYLK